MIVLVNPKTVPQQRAMHKRTTTTTTKYAKNDFVAIYLKINIIILMGFTLSLRK